VRGLADGKAIALAGLDELRGASVERGRAPSAAYGIVRRVVNLRRAAGGTVRGLGLPGAERGQAAKMFRQISGLHRGAVERAAEEATADAVRVGCQPIPLTINQ